MEDKAAWLMLMKKIALKEIHKSYSEKEGTLKALEGLSLGVRKGEIVSLVGPSGCGKTTLLKIIAGFLDFDSGTALIDGQEINGHSTKVGLIFQDLALFEWKTARQNIEFPLNIQNLKEDEKKNLVARLIGMAGLDGFENSFPIELSGGMRQRLAIARALAADHDVLLMDEPMASLDMHTRELLAEKMENLLSQSGKTIMLVTHHLEEAVFFSDRVVVLSERPGKVKDILEIDFSHPRAPEIKSKQRFHSIKNSLWRSLRQKQKGGIL